MAWTTPKTWAAGVLLSSDLNTHVRDNLNYLYGRRTDSTVITYEGANGTTSISFTGAGWRTLPITNEYGDADSNVTIDTANDRFTLPAGTYLVQISTGRLSAGFNAIRLYNFTDSIQVGTQGLVGSTTGLGSSGQVIVTIASSKVFEAQMWISTTSTIAAITSGATECFAQIYIQKISD